MGVRSSNSTPGSARASTVLGPNINLLLSARKDILISASTKMKQLQWDKLPQQQADKTVFSEEDSSREAQWVKKLQMENIWQEMEDDFKAKQLVINLMNKQKKAELKSVLDPQTKKSVGQYSNKKSVLL
jgi:cytokinesis protein